MPQDVPVEGSEVLPFTPASLKDIDGAPVFILRAVTSREKRFRLRMHREEGILTHTEPTIRGAIRDGLKEQWTEQQQAQFLPWIEAYWSALDEFRLIRKADPEAEWEYDEQVEDKVLELIGHLERSYRPLARMNADIAEYNEMAPKFYAAVTVKSWTGLDVTRELDRKYLTLDCVDALQDALDAFAEKHDRDPVIAWLELYAACLNRHILNEDEAKNSESPSPSSTPPAPSSETSGPQDGKSPASASSRKTRKRS